MAKTTERFLLANFHGKSELLQSLSGRLPGPESVK